MMNIYHSGCGIGTNIAPTEDMSSIGCVQYIIDTNPRNATHLIGKTADHITPRFNHCGNGQRLITFTDQSLTEYGPDAAATLQAYAILQCLHYQ